MIFTSKHEFSCILVPSSNSAKLEQVFILKNTKDQDSQSEKTVQSQSESIPTNESQLLDRWEPYQSPLQSISITS